MGFTIRPPGDSAGAAWPAIAVGLFVAFGGILYGYEYVNHRTPKISEKGNR
jgi:MFS transporter, SP family, sugar:H+ symporter